MISTASSSGSGRLSRSVRLLSLSQKIDGTEPEGYAADVRRDRLLRRAGIDVIHILNSEIMQHGVDIIGALMPRMILPGPPGGRGFAPFSVPF